MLTRVPMMTWGRNLIELWRAGRPWTCWKLYCTFISMIEGKFCPQEHLLESGEIFDPIKRRPTKEDRDANRRKGCSPPESVRDKCRSSLLTLIMHPARKSDYQNNRHNKQGNVLRITNPPIGRGRHGQDIHQQAETDADNDNA